MKLLSFAIPCYNSAAYMEKCIQSVLAGGEDVEVIIVDDGSTKDETAKIADEYVEKQEVNEKAHKHYENIKSNIRYLNENGIKTVDYIENQIIRSKYIEQKNLLNNRLTELLEEQRNDEFYEILDKFFCSIYLLLII